MLCLKDQEVTSPVTTHFSTSEHCPIGLPLLGSHEPDPWQALGRQAALPPLREVPLFTPLNSLFLAKCHQTLAVLMVKYKEVSSATSQ